MWAVGNDGHSRWVRSCRVRSNGGSTWTTPTRRATDAEVTISSRLSATTAYIAQHNRYLTDIDGGVSDLVPDSIGAAVNAIDASDVNNVVVVGDAGKVYYSANAAAATPTWVRSTRMTNNLNGVRCSAPTLDRRW